MSYDKHLISLVIFSFILSSANSFAQSITSQAFSFDKKESIPACLYDSSDPDGDGWGWEDMATCKVGGPVHYNSHPVCKFKSSDPDGDGWGWENHKSCKLTDETGSEDNVQNEVISALEEENSSEIQETQNPASSDSNFWTVGSYAPGCLGTTCAKVSDIDWSAFTHIMHFSLSPTDVMNAKSMKDVRELMSAKPKDTGIILVVGSEGHGQMFNNLTSQQHKTFSTNLAKIIQKDGYMGVS